MAQEPLQFVAEEAEADIRVRAAKLFDRQTMIASDKAVMCRLLAAQAFGSDNALSIKRMQEQWRRDGLPVYPARAIKRAVKNLLEVYDLPIGASRIAPKNGYYFLTNDEEAEAAARPLKNEIFSLFRRIKVISPRSPFVRKLQGQIALLREDG